jgi:hypothetical protein
MRIEDLNNIIKEYAKHFGKDKMAEYFKSIIKIKSIQEHWMMLNKMELFL